ncbi:oligosaccharide flippase family protein [Flagellimonas sp. S3867]|uniref:oligosaccharide flippase family protein n=1 Tax=Flagellimonas sp. S3867 TaxID=2768063 RepID=UPI001686D98D|nr:oligosaccharide flippase family protein [Flagellimonas sp. S3867]
MSQINKNILANVLGRGWSMFSVFIFIPIYISILGVKMYGIISFYAILQGVIIFVDAGLTATLRRELAKGDDSNESRKSKYKILRSIEFLYFLIITALILCVFFSAEFIVGKWLNIEDLDLVATTRSIQIMGIALGLNFFSTLYQGGLLGLEKQVASNTLQVLWGVLKNGGVILAVLFIGKTLIVFFLWQAACNLVYVIVLRRILFGILKKKEPMVWLLSKDLLILRKVWKYATGMLIISIISAINNQFDKFFISSTFSVSELAIYTVSYSLAMVPIVISTPIAIAVFPRFVKYHSKSQNEKLYELFNNSFVLTLLLTASAGISLALNSSEFLLLWTQNTKISMLAALPAALLLIGQTLLSFQVIPFNLSIAIGDTKTIIKTGTCGIVLFIPLVIVLTKYYGIAGAAASWLLNSLIITPALIVLIVKKATDFSLRTWILMNFVKPLLFISVGNFFFYLIKPELDSNPIFGILYVIVSSLIIFLFSFKLMFRIKVKNTIKFIKNELFA